MKQPHALALAALSLLLTAGTSQAAIVLDAVGTYDEDLTNTNTVDRYATGTVDDYNAFKSAVSSAFTAGNGGVLNFDLTGNQNNQRTITGNFGSGKVLTIESSTDVNAQSSSNIPGISGDRFLFESTSTTPQITTYTITGLTGGTPGEYVSQIGFTLLTRNSAGGNNRTITASVRFTDGTFSDLASAVFNQTASGEDTFFHFTAPEGKAIDQLIIDRGNSGDFRRGIDDFAFITAVPEPSALALGALGLLPLLRRRRM